MGRINKNRLPQLHEEINKAIAFDHPRLMAQVVGRRVIVEGTFSIFPTTEEFEASGAIASYSVRIEIPATYPYDEPKIYELGNAFPHNADYHCNPKGDCCICVFETWRATAVDNSFESYLNGPIRNFFLSQFIKAETDEWPFDEWKHGLEGYVEACADRLGCDNNLDEVDYLLRVLSRPWPRGHWDCPCKSGKKIKNCCSQRLQDLACTVGNVEARSMRKRLHELSG